MTKKYLLVLAAALVGCGGGGKGNTDGALPPGDMSMGNKSLVAVTGVSIDADLLLGLFLMNPSYATETNGAAMLIAAAANPNAPIYGRYEDTTKTAVTMSDATGNFTIMANANTNVYMVADTYATNNTLATLTNEPIAVGTAAVSGAVAHACTTNPYSVPSGISLAASIGTDVLLGQGVSLVGTSPTFPFPFVQITPNTSFTLSDTSYSVYGGQAPPSQTAPPMFTLSTTATTTAALGIIGFTKAAGAAAATVTVTPTDPTGMVTFPPTPVLFAPGFVVFAGLEGTS